MCYVQACPVSGYVYSNYISNSTNSKPTMAYVEVCTDDALLHGIGLMQSELVLLALCCGGDYNQVSPIFCWSDSDATTHAPILRDCISAHQIHTHLVSHW